jgi:hypothetical protein
LGANVHRYRPSSGTFRKRQCASIYLADQLAEESRQPASVIDGYPEHSLSASVVERVRAKEQEVVRSPTDDEPAHGDIVGKKSSACADRLARATTRIFLDEDAIRMAEKAKELADPDAPTLRRADRRRQRLLSSGHA